jgi:hypothetical protein
MEVPMKKWTWIAWLAMAALLAGCAPKEGAKADQAGPAQGEAAPQDGAKTGAQAAAAADQKGKGKTVAARKPPAQTEPVNLDATLRDVAGDWEFVIPGRAAQMNVELKRKGKRPFEGRLEIRPDGSYTFVFGLAGQGARTTGRASIKDGVLSLVAKDDGGAKAKVKAQPVGETYTFKLSVDGKRLLSNMPDRAMLNFVRQ